MALLSRISLKRRFLTGTRGACYKISTMVILGRLGLTVLRHAFRLLSSSLRRNQKNGLTIGGTLRAGYRQNFMRHRSVLAVRVSEPPCTVSIPASA